LPAPPEPFLIDQLTSNRIRLLPISIGSIFYTGQLPAHHKDPFDRLIAAQCLRHSLTLISVDTIFDAYGVRRVFVRPPHAIVEVLLQSRQSERGAA
jgi:PIN domain nuclease of toxin-antitoxin system